VAKTYFLGSDAAEMMAALDTIFADVMNQGLNVGQAAVSSTRLTTDGAIYQGNFDTANWNGDLMRQRVTLNSAGNPVISAPDDAATLHAGAVLDRTDPATRRIFVGKTTPGLTGTATEFKWTALDADHKEALRRPPAQTPLDSDAVGQQRLEYLRGDRSQEANGALRARGGRLGDIVNSGAVYMGKPGNVVGNAAYSAFVEANKNRPPTVFVGANDGMLHAFHGDTMAELFAYVPSFLVKSLRELTLPSYVHRSYVDATPAVAEAQVGSAWKTVLVGGVGAGGQGVFALDVSNPASFGAGNVLWEFTDRHDPALGNVIGRPRILKLRTSAPGAPGVYKYFAVVPGGVNNHAADGAASTSGQAAIFLLDLAKAPTTPWQLGSNYFRIELPSLDTTKPNGVVGLSAVSGAVGEVKSLYAGDLQGQLWKLDFGAAGSAQWTAAGLSAFKSGTTPLPFFKATDASGTPQPITMEPEIVFGPARRHIVTFGTGKLLETADASRPYKAQTFYAIYDNGQAAVPGRGHLRQAAMPSAGVVETGAFVWGVPANPGTQANVRAGWYLDFPGVTQGERQIDGITIQSGMAVFGTVQPPEHGCGDGAGNLYVIDLATGDGRSAPSTVGLQGQPLLLKLGRDQLTDSRSDGRANQQTRYQILTQGSSGTKFSDLVPNIPDQSILQRSWRQVFNYEEMKKWP
jgi:type IV pilus assembly protein PilY1